MNDNFTQVITALISDEKGRVLVSKRSFSSQMPGQWQNPGGKLEKGESHIEALKREVKEETDLEVKEVGDLIFRVVDKENKFDVYFYEVRVTGIPKAKEPDKVSSEWVYLTLKELEKEEVIPDLMEAIRRWKNKN